jgi:type IV pilus assembly protein PilP
MRVLFSIQTVAVVGLALLLSACGSESVPKTTAAKPKAPAPAMQVVEAEEEPVQEYRYDPEGKADPFESFIQSAAVLEVGTSPLERFDLSQLEVTAIIWGTNRKRALVTDPAGKGYIVAEGASIGKNQGRIVSIDDNVVLVKETYVDFRDRATTKEVEMRLYESQGG